jgi:F-type H+-transporting ATPase subunit epsilon
MADKSFKLEIVTPRRVVFSGEVISFSAPGVEGNFQVLYSHAPMLSAIEIGEVKIQDFQGKELHYATSGGFVEVRDNQVILLAESAERSDEIDTTRAESSKERASKRLTEKKPDTDLERAKASLTRALNRIRIAHKV